MSADRILSSRRADREGRGRDPHRRPSHYKEDRVMSNQKNQKPPKTPTPANVNPPKPPIKTSQGFEKREAPSGKTERR